MIAKIGFLTGAAVVLALAMPIVSGPTSAQGLAAGKICQVVRTCNFARSAEVRGCLSSYSCRRCDFRVVRARSGQKEWRSTCLWGAGS